MSNLIFKNVYKKVILTKIEKNDFFIHRKKILTKKTYLMEVKVASYLLFIALLAKIVSLRHFFVASPLNVL